ncbi:MAG: thioredoxin family protein [bacterium]|nr:thioredoxin family protein [bacterium]
MRSFAAFLVALSLMVPTAASAQEAESNSELWYPQAEAEAGSIALYFVYSETCPHCSAAKPLIEDLETTYDWLKVVRVSTQTASDEEIDTVLTLADELGEDIVGVPTFLFCARMEVGFDSIETTGVSIESSLVACHEYQRGETTEPEEPEEDLHVPVLGDIDANAVSLPLFAVAIAGLDAFNPCAFFVLLFLLSLLVHARSRWRMALVGGVFVVISGVMYFAFMAAWLNVFLVTGQLRWVTAIAGLVALALAIFNMKDYFFPGAAGSISIPDSAKPGLFARMRKLTTGDAMPTVLLGTVALAAVANSYELLCTAGFPLVFTRVLTLNDLSTSSYYGYLGLYNVVYVIPLLIIVGVFVWTLGSRKLSETEGRFLKLMSGTMMFGLALLLLFKPDLLENMFAAVGIMGVAVLTAFAVSYWDKHRHTPVSPTGARPG